ncbi:MAG: hypothetical protein NXI20_00605 [bacterium]|nr:hypothetical protein [bacterium]
MHDEKLIDDLFEAARTEESVRSLASVEQFVQTTAGTNTSLLVQWLKQYKMNILITTSGIAITAAIFLFPQKEPTKQSVITEIEETPEVQIVEEPVESITVPKESTSKKSSETHEEPEMDKSNNSVANEGDEIQDNSKQPIIQQQKPVTRTTSPARVNSSTVKAETTEYKVILESSKGKSSVDQFSDYLEDNLTQLDHEFTSSSSKNEIKKFTLKLDNRIEANFRMQVAGFTKLELSWEVDAEGEIQNMWYKIDEKEVSELDFSKENKSSVRVKHRHQEF